MVKELDITVIILTYNEEIHIRRCLENVKQIAKDIIVVDSHSTDGTIEICKEYGVNVIRHKWPGYQAAQFNWAINNVPIKTEWILRIDADEYLLPELIVELKDKLPLLRKEVTGIEFKRRHIFMGRWVKHGIYPVKLLRMFRVGCAYYNDRVMDEHLMLTSGKSIMLENDFCDHSLIGISDYCKKHIQYAQREAIAILEESIDNGIKDQDGSLSGQAKKKQNTKKLYNRMPFFWRSFVYFVYRYFLKGGFLDGKEGFLFAFIQGWWYRTLVDAKVYEIKKACGNDKVKIAEHLRDVYFIDVK